MTNKWMRFTGFLFAVCVLAAMPAQVAIAAVLKQETIAAFDRFVKVVEARMAADDKNGHFLFLDTLPEDQRTKAYESVRQGEVFATSLRKFDDGQRVKIPSGAVHHWVGVVFVPKATIARVVDIVNDYPDQAKIYAPDVQESKLIEHSGDDYKIFLRLYSKSVVTVVYNANFDAHNTKLDESRLESRTYSTRIAEVADPGTPEEHEYPVGNDHGYLWRLNNYWRMQEKDGGTYVQIEVLELSRGVPIEFAWIVDSLSDSLPRKTITRLLNSTRRAVEGPIKPK
ncbi:MAG: hypothetical protein WA734_17215 [Candidatus Acidiferrales bacterium]